MTERKIEVRDNLVYEILSEGSWKQESMISHFSYLVIDATKNLVGTDLTISGIIYREEFAEPDRLQKPVESNIDFYINDPVNAVVLTPDVDGIVQFSVTIQNATDRTKVRIRATQQADTNVFGDLVL